MPLRIIATADVHLGMKFSGYGDRSGDLAEARFSALESVVKLGNERSCDLLVVAGDLFDRVAVAAPVVERAAAILGAFEGAAVAVLPGNHDYLSTAGDRLWRSFMAAAGDRTILLDAAAPRSLAHYDLPVTILAAPCDSLHGASHRLDFAIDAERGEFGDTVVIGVAHGSVEGITLDAEGVYFPMSIDALRRTSADFWIIGHTHRFHHLPDARVVVPGTPEPDGFDVLHPGSVAIIEIDDGYRVVSEEIGTYLFVDARIELGVERDPAEQIRSVLPDRPAVVRVSVHGRLNADDFRRWNDTRDALLRDRVVYRIDDDDVQRLLTLEEIDREYVAGSFAHALLSRLVRDGDHEAVTEALSLMREIEA